MDGGGCDYYQWSARVLPALLGDCSELLPAVVSRDLTLDGVTKRQLASEAPSSLEDVGPFFPLLLC